MKKHLLAFFTYSSRERRGIIALLILLAVLNLFFEGYSLFFKNELSIPIQLDTLSLELIPDESVNSESPSFSHEQRAKQKDVQGRVSIPQALFPFDPNSATVLEWQRLGLTIRQATGILHYLEKGGRYRIKSDLKKMYGMSDSLYAKLEPYIQLPDSVASSSKLAPESPSKRAEKKYRILELNTADSLALLDLPGIGPWFAFRIVHYRQRLGGFVRKDQLLEVRGIDSVRYSQLSAMLTVDPFEVQKTDVNKATLEVLGQHPYIGYLLAKMMVNYRLQHGNFRRMEEIKALPLVDADLYSKLAPYLSLSP